MSIIDIICIVLIVINVFFTLKKGVIRTIFETAGILVGALVSYLRCDEYALLLELKTGITGLLAVLISYIAIYAIVFFAFLLLGLLIQKIINKTILAPISYALAIIFGTIKGLFFSSILILIVMMASRFAEPLKTELSSSYMASFVNKVIVMPVKNLMPDDINEKISDSLNIKKIIRDEIKKTVDSSTEKFSQKSQGIRGGLREKAENIMTRGVSLNFKTKPQVSKDEKNKILENLKNNKTLQGMNVNIDNLRELLDETLDSK